MTQKPIMETQLITPRRNFLIRALGFTAAGATMAVPITTLADAQSRIDHHCQGLETALRDRYGADVMAPPHIRLPEPGEIAFDETKGGRAYHRRPIVMFMGYGGWIDPPY